MSNELASRMSNEVAGEVPGHRAGARTSGHTRGRRRGIVGALAALALAAPAAAHAYELEGGGVITGFTWASNDPLHGRGDHVKGGGAHGDARATLSTVNTYDNPTSMAVPQGYLEGKGPGGYFKLGDRVHVAGLGWFRVDDLCAGCTPENRKLDAWMGFARTSEAEALTGDLTPRAVHVFHVGETIPASLLGAAAGPSWQAETWSDRAHQAGTSACSVSPCLTIWIDGREGPSSRVLWHAGTFRTLPEQGPADLLAFVEALPHPNANGYGAMSEARRTAFEALLAKLFAAVDAGLVDGERPDWCGVQAAADAAGYVVARFWDTGVDAATGAARNRWYVYGYDRTSFGQAYFFVNPRAKRDLVIEAPHAGHERHTDGQAARLFVDLAARALVVNKDHRCSSFAANACGGGSSACDEDGDAGVPRGIYRKSDVAHNTANAFHLLHRALSDLPGGRTRFVQLHGMGTDASDLVHASDGSTLRGAPTSTALSARFVDALRTRLAGTRWATGGTYSCQRDELPAGNPPLCATENVQGRHTNGGAGAALVCPASASTGGRFLHLEQQLDFRKDDLPRGYVRDAVRAVLGACDMTADPGDCALGPPQTRYEPRACR